MLGEIEIEIEIAVIFLYLVGIVKKKGTHHLWAQPIKSRFSLKHVQDNN